jgi:hypothetical protein
MVKSLHYWKIHGRVAKRLLGDLDRYTQALIANDALHLSETFKWFENKVANDTERLFSDEHYYDNRPETFKYSRVEPLDLQIGQLTCLPDWAKP